MLRDRKPRLWVAPPGFPAAAPQPPPSTQAPLLPWPQPRSGRPLTAPVLRCAPGLARTRTGECPPRPLVWPPAQETCWLLPSGRSGAGTRNRAMEDPSGAREPRARPRERDPGRRPHPDRDRAHDRQRDRPGDTRREQSSDGNRRRDRDRDRERDQERDRNRDRDRERERKRDPDRGPRRDRHRDAGPRAGEHGVWEKPRQSRTRDEARGPTWDSAAPPGPAPWEAPEPPHTQRKGGPGYRGPER